MKLKLEHKKCRFLRYFLGSLTYEFQISLVALRCLDNGVIMLLVYTECIKNPEMIKYLDNKAFLRKII